MKTIARILLLFLIPAMQEGCKSYMNLKYDITQPGTETPESLIVFLQKNQFPVHDLYMFRDSSAYRSALVRPEIRKNLLSHMLFDRDGKWIDRDTAKCQWAGSEAIRSLHADSNYLSTDQITLDQITRLIVPFGPDKGPVDPTAKVDFTLVVIWAKFLGKYNYRLFDLEKAAGENKTATIRMILLNMDMQKEWNLTSGNSLKIR
ncbi:MAG: hypothetical protein EOM90_02395 [Alphaproteobacteria bacterium]|nr:hypothetical protein [Alphaproteobacteria bacterium]